MNYSGSFTFPAFFEQTVKNYGNNKALTFVDDKPLTYNELDSQIKSLITLFESLQIKKGDKIAILSANMPNWGISYFATTFMGAVAVPLLPDFSPAEIENVLNHSETKIILVSVGLKHKLNEIKTPSVFSKINIEDFSIYEGRNQGFKVVENTIPAENYDVTETDLAAIIYTSGTTGKSKGVMLTHKNIAYNALAANDVQNIVSTDRFLSILPLSHTYENTLGLVLPMWAGACVYYLKKPPVPTVLLPALKKVRPTIMLTVPLIIEKIYRNKILPSFTDSKIMSFLYKLPPFRILLNRIAGKKLMQTFGGCVHFFGVGGAKLDRTVEKFLREAKFPYAIGYGLTETSPLLAGANPHQTRLQGAGPGIIGLEVKINNPDPITKEGEIWAKGPTIMQGYYKEPELTKEVITEDGWFRTGDLGVMDETGFVSIRGRLKNMILGASGENIYPEDIESIINNFRYVVESVVVQHKGKLVALVHFNREELERRYNHLRNEVTDYVEYKVEELRVELQTYVNSRVNRFSQVQLVVAQPNPFQKTATQKIKRFMYTVV